MGTSLSSPMTDKQQDSLICKILLKDYGVQQRSIVKSFFRFHFVYPNQQQITNILNSTKKHDRHTMLALLLHQVPHNVGIEINGKQILDDVHFLDFDQTQKCYLLLKSKNFLADEDGSLLKKLKQIRPEHQKSRIRRLLKQQTKNISTSSLQEDSCLVCREYKKTVIFRECGHLVLCAKCALSLKSNKCPTCRKESTLQYIFI